MICVLSWYCEFVRLLLKVIWSSWQWVCLVVFWLVMVILFDRFGRLCSWVCKVVIRFDQLLDKLVILILLVNLLFILIFRMIVVMLFDQWILSFQMFGFFWQVLFRFIFGSLLQGQRFMVYCVLFVLLWNRCMVFRFL